MNILTKIDSNISAAEKILKSLSGIYQTNTCKRMNEEAHREKKRQAISNEIEILNYLKSKSTLSEFEVQLLTKTFRNMILEYCKATTLSYPKPDPQHSNDHWWNTERIKRAKALAKAEVFTLSELKEKIDEFKEVLENVVSKPDPIKIEIRKLENKYKLYQTGDVFFTPKIVVDRMIELTEINGNSVVLEPSAGIGHIADRIKEISKDITCIEISSSFSDLLSKKGYKVICGNFIEINPVEKYDAIIMNPPFSNNQDIVHLQHAFKFLKPGGKLACLTSPHWTFANDKKSIEFRDWISQFTHIQESFPPGTFEMTNVSTILVFIERQW